MREINLIEFTDEPLLMADLDDVDHTTGAVNIVRPVLRERNISGEQRYVENPAMFRSGTGSVFRIERQIVFDSRP